MYKVPGAEDKVPGAEDKVPGAENKVSGDEDKVTLYRCIENIEKGGKGKKYKFYLQKTEQY